ncbi:glycosyltransferase [Chloroflexota bacterium]
MMDRGNKPLKIAMLSVHSCPVGNIGARDTGGMSVYIREIARELGKQGHQVDVFTRVHDPNDTQIVTLGENARLIHLPAGGSEAIHKLALYLYLPDFACNLEKYRRQHNLHYDLVFNHYWLSAWVGKYLKQWWQVPDINMFHTLGAVKNTFGIGSDEPDLRIETEQEMAQQCHHIIAATIQEKKNFVRRYETPAEKISVIPCGVNLGRFRPQNTRNLRQELKLAEGKPLILYVGRIDPLKGIEQLIRAVSLLPETVAARLVIIGGDETRSQELRRLRSLTQELGQQQSVSFLGTVPHEQLPGYYSAADLCVIPSYYESFGLVALESLACGTPVVATDVGEMKNIIRPGETGYIVTDNSPRVLGENITMALARLKKNKQSIEDIRKSVSQFDWSHTAFAVIKLCHQALEKYLPVAP